MNKKFENLSTQEMYEINGGGCNYSEQAWDDMCDSIYGMCSKVKKIGKAINDDIMYPCNKASKYVFNFFKNLF